MSGSSGYHEEEALGKAYDARLMKRLLTYLRPYRWWVVGAVFLLLITSSFQISLAFLTQIAIDDYIASGDEPGLLMMVGLYLAVIAIGFVASYAQIYITQWLGQKVQHDVRMQIYAHLQKLHLAFFDKNPVGRLVTRVSSDVNVLNELFSSGVVSVIGDIFMLVLIVAALLYYNWQLALITFVVMPFLVAATFLFRARVREVYRLVRLKTARLNAFVQEHLSGIKIVQLFVKQRDVSEKFDQISNDLRAAHHRGIYFYAIFFPTVEIIGAVSLGLLLYYGGFRIEAGVLTFGELVAFISLVERFYRPIRDLSEKYNILQNSMASSERIFGLLDTQPVIQDSDRTKTPKTFTGRLEFKNVWFAYNKDEWVLQDVSFAVEPGQTVALVGATGAGKTSLVSLLYRFYDVQQGTIELDGIDIKQWPVNDLRSHLALVVQDVFLFSGTYAGNVRLRNPEISDEETLRALHRVGFGGFLRDAPDGIQTVVKERGATLSTGQKQLLSFARALAHDPDILVLDEATSSVDSTTESLIQNALAELMTGRTSIVVAHRLSTIEKADKIVVLHHGRVREIGRHEELLQRGGIYHRLYQIQYRKQQDDDPAPPKE
ncbi:MAG: ABC transporter ATP-binding protein [bacterium]